MDKKEVQNQEGIAKIQEDGPDEVDLTEFAQLADELENTSENEYEVEAGLATEKANIERKKLKMLEDIKDIFSAIDYGKLVKTDEVQRAYKFLNLLSTCVLNLKGDIKAIEQFEEKVANAVSILKNAEIKSDLEEPQEKIGINTQKSKKPFWKIFGAGVLSLLPSGFSGGSEVRDTKEPTKIEAKLDTFKESVRSLFKEVSKEEQERVNKLISGRTPEEKEKFNSLMTNTRETAVPDFVEYYRRLLKDPQEGENIDEEIEKITAATKFIVEYKNNAAKKEVRKEKDTSNTTEVGSSLAGVKIPGALVFLRQDGSYIVDLGETKDKNSYIIEAKDLNEIKKIGKSFQGMPFNVRTRFNDSMVDEAMKANMAEEVKKYIRDNCSRAVQDILPNKIKDRTQDRQIAKDEAHKKRVKNIEFKIRNGEKLGEFEKKFADKWISK